VEPGACPRKFPHSGENTRQCAFSRTHNIRPPPFSRNPHILILSIHLFALILCALENAEGCSPVGFFRLSPAHALIPTSIPYLTFSCLRHSNGQAMLVGMVLVLWWQLKRRNSNSKGGLGTLLNMAADRARGKDERKTYNGRASLRGRESAL